MPASRPPATATLLSGTYAGATILAAWAMNKGGSTETDDVSGIPIAVAGRQGTGIRGAVASYVAALDVPLTIIGRVTRLAYPASYASVISAPAYGVSGSDIFFPGITAIQTVTNIRVTAYNNDGFFNDQPLGVFDVGATESFALAQSNTQVRGLRGSGLALARGMTFRTDSRKRLEVCGNTQSSDYADYLILIAGTVSDANIQAIWADPFALWSTASPLLSRRRRMAARLEAN